MKIKLGSPNPVLLTNFIFVSDRFKKGVYAISVSGRLPPAVIRDMQTNTIPYRNRDTSKR